ncbi:MAG: TlpA family protein disulfide reductase [Proteobacteria bacterium]|nr:TlpA family protein disulfide reductase [Pseudomonadota bacterium]
MMRLALALVLAVGLLASQAHADAPQPFRKDSWSALRAQYDGKPLAVHFWGLTCGPCRTEMPEWGRFHASHPDAAIVLVHAERPPPTKDPIEAFLKTSGLETARNLAFADAFEQPLRYAVDPRWRGELPMTLLIGRDGTIETIKGSADLAHVARWFETQAR